MAFQRGLDERQEQNSGQIIRDTRTIGMRIADFSKMPLHVALMLCSSGVACILLKSFSEFFLVCGVTFFIYCFLQKIALPFRMPQRSNALDYNDLKPSGKPNKARGIYFIGNDKKTKEELWFTNLDMRTHVLIFGSTGSGKTEALVSMAYNSLLQSSGFIYVDGKGDNGLFSKIFSMVRSMGREDDLLLINFMTGARDIIGPQKKRLSNTLNPFAMGSSSMLSQLIVSLMPGSSSSSDGDMWKGRAIGFVEAIMRVLVVMRDAGHILLDANVIRNYFLLPRLEAIVIDKVFIRDGQESISLENLPSSLLEPINNYVYNLPGYNREKKGKQVSQVLEQHGYITMQLTRIFTSLADTYSHILRTNLAEVDLSDVVLNRRILCVLLPALEKSPDELANLGKIIIATLKAMMAAGLGDSVEGDVRDIVDSRPHNADTPFLCILDEYGYYAVEGFAVVPAQARSLGFSVVFAGQDLPAFQKASKEEAASIGANTNIKICMKLEDPTETWDFFMKSAGESYVTQVENFQVDTGSVLGNYKDGRGARVEKRARIDLLDLKEQDVGEGHLFFKSKIVRFNSFFANPKPVKKIRLNHFLKINAPEDAEIEKLKNSFEAFSALANSDFNWDQDTHGMEEFSDIVDFYAENCKLAPLDRALASLQTFKIDDDDIPEDFLAELLKQDDEETGHVNVFTPLHFTEHLQSVIPPEKHTDWSIPLIDRSFTREKVEYLERLNGRTSQQAMNVAIELIADMQTGTHYPSRDLELPDEDTLIKITAGLKDKINLLIQKDSKSED